MNNIGKNFLPVRMKSHPEYNDFVFTQSQKNKVESDEENKNVKKRKSESEDTPHKHKKKKKKHSKDKIDEVVFNATIIPLDNAMGQLKTEMESETHKKKAKKNKKTKKDNKPELIIAKADNKPEGNTCLDITNGETEVKTPKKKAKKEKKTSKHKKYEQTIIAPEIVSMLSELMIAKADNKPNGSACIDITNGESEHSTSNKKEKKDKKNPKFIRHEEIPAVKIKSLDAELIIAEGGDTAEGKFSDITNDETDSETPKRKKTKHKKEAEVKIEVSQDLHPEVNVTDNSDDETPKKKNKKSTSDKNFKTTYNQEDERSTSELSISSIDSTKIALMLNSLDNACVGDNSATPSSLSKKMSISSHKKEDNMFNTLIGDMLKNLEVDDSDDEEHEEEQDLPEPQKTIETRTQSKTKKSPRKSRQRMCEERNDSVSKISNEDVELLKSLVILLPFDVPELHRIETRLTIGPTTQQKVQIDALELKVKKGIYSKEEDKQLKRNWKEFCKQHDLPPKPEWFVNFTHEVEGVNITPLNRGERLNFVRFLAHGLNNRLLHSVYTHFRAAFNGFKHGQFSKEEDAFIMETVENLKSNTKFAYIGRELNRHRIAVEKRFVYLSDKEKQKFKDKRVLKEEAQLIVQKLLEELHLKDVHELKNKQISITVFNKIGAELKLRPLKVQQYWYNNLHPRLFVTGTRTLWKVKKRLLKTILRNPDVKDMRDVNFGEIVPNMDGWTTYALSKMLHNSFQCLPDQKCTFRELVQEALDSITGKEQWKLNHAEYTDGQLIMD